VAEGLLCERVETSAGSEDAFVFPARRGRMRLALTPTRVIATSAVGTVELPWPLVADVAVYEMPGGRSPLLGIAATKPGAAVWTRAGWLGRLNRRVTPYEVSFKASAFAVEADDIIHAIKRYQRDARRRRAIGSEPERARLLGERSAPA
jgi:hypothetical protein